MDKKILYQPWGGLGDNLSFSTLPRRFAEQGIDFFISDKNVYRNSEIYDLVWKLNPYVKGLSSEKYNSGDIPFNREFGNKSIIYNEEFNHGLDPINELPEIYYTPNHETSIDGSILLDTSTFTFPAGMSDSIVDELKEKYPGKEIVAPKFRTKLSDNTKTKIVVPDRFVEVESIFHYCDLINSCYHFVCPFSGQSVLASALNKKDTTCYIPASFSNHSYVFPNINYYSYKI